MLFFVFKASLYCFHKSSFTELFLMDVINSFLAAVRDFLGLKM